MQATRDASRPGPKPVPPADRFWPKVNKNGPIPTFAPHLGPCWLWTASCNPQGYGQFRLHQSRGPLGAHRWAYENVVGPVPDGLELDHLCRVPLCVNPTHLEPVTGEENLRRAAAAVTHCAAGHEFTAENTRLYRGHRRCITCDLDRQRATREAMTPEQREAKNAKKRADYHASKGRK